GGFDVRAGVEKLAAGGDAESGHPALVRFPVELEHAAATAGARGDVWAVVALPPGDAQGLVLEVVGPDVADHLLDLTPARWRGLRARDAATASVVAGGGWPRRVALW